MENKFKVGDRVKTIAQSCGNKKVFGEIGTIRIMDDDCYLVEFDNDIDGHDGNTARYHGKDKHCWWVDKEILELSKQKAYRVIFKDNATILFKDGKKYVAKCCDGDTYDREKGLLVCLAKAHGYTFNDLQEMLESAEAPKGKVREVERNAEVGEYIKVVNIIHSRGYYKKNDIIKVKEMCGGYVVVKDNWTIAPSEYVVLENYKPNKYKITLSEFFGKGAKNAIHIKTLKEYNQFIKASNKKGHFERWYISSGAMEWLKSGIKDVCLGYKDCDKTHGFCGKDYYGSKGYKIYNFNEVDLNN